jgi:hypothetical protein
MPAIGGEDAAMDSGLTDSGGTSQAVVSLCPSICKVGRNTRAKVDTGREALVHCICSSQKTHHHIFVRFTNQWPQECSSLSPVSMHRGALMQSGTVLKQAKEDFIRLCLPLLLLCNPGSAPKTVFRTQLVRFVRYNKVLERTDPPHFGFSHSVLPHCRMNLSPDFNTDLYCLLLSFCGWMKELLSHHREDRP